MSKARPTVGSDGLPLPILPPDRDARVWARLVRIMFYLPGFMGLLLIKTGEPSSFGITVELLMLSSASAVVGGLFIGSQSDEAGSNAASQTGTWAGSLILELLAVVPFLAAVPSLFHELASSSLLHARLPSTVDVALGASELLPAIAIVPFLLYEVAGFGTLNFVLGKLVNYALNAVVFLLIVAAYVANRRADYGLEKTLSATLVVLMAIVALYGVLKLKKMQEDYDARLPVKAPKV